MNHKVAEAHRKQAAGTYSRDAVWLLTTAGVVHPKGQEVVHAVATDSVDRATVCSGAGLALQPRLGLLPERRTRAHHIDSGDPAADGADLTRPLACGIGFRNNTAQIANFHSS